MLSVIIPSHNRVSSAVKLAKTLDAHECSRPFEIVFALDGCTDGTKEALETLDLRRSLKLAELPGLGPAGARNAGAAAAEGDLLLFIDDDEIPQPGMIDAHLAMHKRGSQVAVVGPCPYAPEIPVNPLDFRHRDWWQAKFMAMEDPTHRFTYQDVLTGNLSLPHRTFESLGRFDEKIKGAGREDWEFGIRLLNSGTRLEYAPSALAYHYPVSRPASVLKKCYTNGKADVYFSRKHPEVFDTLPVRRYCRRNGRLWMHLKSWMPLLMLDPAKVVSAFGYLFERNIDKLWDWRILSLWGKCEKLAYLMGLVSAAGGVREFEAFLEEQMPRSEWPDQAVCIKDLELQEGFSEIGEAASHDRIFLLPRIGGRPLYWIEVPCQGEPMPAREIAGQVAQCASWQTWRSIAVPADDPNLSIGELDNIAWQRFRKKVDSLPSLSEALEPSTRKMPKSLPSLSVIVVAGRAHAVPNSYNELDRVEIIPVSSDGKLAEELADAVFACKGDVIAFLRPDDQVDKFWAESVLRHFDDPTTACVLSPVVPRNMRTRGEELYKSLVDLNRVQYWQPCDLNAWGNPAYALREFNMVAHRMVVSKAALRRCCKAMPFEPANDIEAFLGMFGSLVLNWERVMYEPKSIVWRTTQLYVPEVREMASEHSLAVAKLVSARLLASPGRIRALRMIPKLARYHLHRLRKSALRRTDWPTSFAMVEAASCVRGILRIG